MLQQLTSVGAPSQPQPTLVQASGGGQVVAVLGGTMLLWAAAQTAIDLPLSPWHFSTLTFAVLLIGAAYGARLGAATVLAYLAQGAAGMPVFANGAGGLDVLTSSGGGYLVGFVFAAYVVGRLAERGWDRNPLLAAAAIVAGHAATYAVAVVWLSRYVGWDTAWSAGVRPYLEGDLVQAGLAGVLLPAVWAVLRVTGLRR